MEALSKLDVFMHAEFHCTTDYCTDTEDEDAITKVTKLQRTEEDDLIPPVYTLKGDVARNKFSSDESGMIIILFNFLFNSFFTNHKNIYILFLS